MPTVTAERVVPAPPECVFDLARSVDLHTESQAANDERAVAGVTEGLLEAGDRVTWEARHLGRTRRMTVEMATVERPRHFRDVQVEGPFARLQHDHRFEGVDGGTRVVDELSFASPLGPIGTAVDALYLGRYMQRLVEGRQAHLAGVLERDEAERFLPETA